MGAIRRRTVIAGATTAAAAAGTTAVAGGVFSPSRVAAAETADATAPLAPVSIGRDDPRYEELTRGINQRWVSDPDYIRMVSTTEQTVQAVQDAVDNRKRISVQGGGHCYADFVHNSAVKAVINMSEMKAVYFDKGKNAFAVEAGATLLEAYETLFKYWGVTLPGGMCFSVGIGGHVAGGGYGLLSRRLGLVIDHLYAVEVVTVDEAGKAKAVVATREKDDPNRELWWAHTGGGGGNFGVVTRYWFRSRGATGTDPSQLLPQPPSSMVVNTVPIPWSELDKASFTRFVQNYTAWHEANSDVNSAGSGLTSFALVYHKANGEARLLTVVDGSDEQAEQTLKNYLTELTKGTKIQPDKLYQPQRMPWFTAARLLATDNPVLTSPTLRGDYKSAYMKKGFTDGQIASMHKHLTRSDYRNETAIMVLLSYGGQVNTVASDETSSAQRDSAYKLLIESFWSDSSEDAEHIAWCREVFTEIFASTGGYPVPNSVTDGCYINYPDTDIINTEQNKSGVPWSKLYYKDNYPRLQKAKAAYDPKNIFRHSQSIELPKKQS